MSFLKKSCLLFAVLAMGCASDDGAAAESAPLAQLDDPQVATPESGSDGGTALVSPFAGSAAENQCLSYTAAKPGMCMGYFCGATESQLAAAIPADSLCPDPKLLCNGGLLTAVAKCARSTIIANLGSPIDPLKPKMEECVFADPTVKDLVSKQCVGCYLNAAACAATNCLVPCLSDSPACDQCRAKNNCEKPVFECAKLPSPL